MNIHLTDPRLRKIIEFVDDLCDENKVIAWNFFCLKAKRTEDHIYKSSEFDWQMRQRKLTPTDIACKVFFGSANPTHDYWWFDHYENIGSCERLSWKDCPFDSYSVARWAIDEDEDFGYDTIRKILSKPAPPIAP